MQRSRIFFFVVAFALGVAAVACAEEEATPEDGEQQTPPALSTVGEEALNVGIVFTEDEETITLRGHLFGPDNEVGVILAHMKPNDQRAWLPFARELADRGYAALTFDFRGYGETGGDTDFAKLDEDLREALRYMRVDQGKEKVFLIGASMGGTTSLVVAAQPDIEVAGVVAASAPSQFEEQDALSVVGNITEPKLFIASEGDEAHIISLEELFGAAGQPKEQEVYPGRAHGTELLDSENSTAFRERILRFLDEHR